MLTGDWKGEYDLDHNKRPKNLNISILRKYRLSKDGINFLKKGLGKEKDEQLP